MRPTLTALLGFPLLGLSLSYFGCSPDDSFQDEPAVDAGIDGGEVEDSGIDPNLDPKERLIYCLINSGMEFFSLEYCGECQDNINLFEPYWHHMEDAGRYYDCAEEKELCKQLDISAVPTWLWDRNDPQARYVGLVRLHCFKDFVGCVYDGPAEGKCPDKK